MDTGYPGIQSALAVIQIVWGSGSMGFKQNGDGGNDVYGSLTRTSMFISPSPEGFKVIKPMEILFGGLTPGGTNFDDYLNSSFHQKWFTAIWSEQLGNMDVPVPAEEVMYCLVMCSGYKLLVPINGDGVYGVTTRSKNT
ncbi:hypothetical protein RIMDOsaka138_21460 [Escherichia coli]|nr:hypothetical protein RIMDOsaka138_21460 [Escherichia coli]